MDRTARAMLIRIAIMRAVEDLESPNQSAILKELSERNLELAAPDIFNRMKILVDSNHIEQSDNGKRGGKTYQVTEKGREYMQTIYILSKAFSSI